METPAKPAATTTQQIPVDKIVPSPYQARKNFDEQALKELAQTIKDRGLENAILVRPLGDRFELIAGERRWRAVKTLGWQTIEAKVEAVDDKEAYLRGLVENVQREDLSPIEQAIAYRKLTQTPFELSQTVVAGMVGKDRTVVSKYINVAKLGDSPAGVHACTPLALRHLLELVRVSDPSDQIALATEAAKKDLSADQLKTLVDKITGPKQNRAAPRHNGVSPTNDPLAALWEPLLMQAQVSGKPWGVTYGPKQLPGMKGVYMPAWQFWVVNNGMVPKAELRRWFLQMADVMGDTDQEQSRAEKTLETLIPRTQAEMKQMMQECRNPRLPQSPEDHAELDKLAVKGPAAVYGWIYGKDSLNAKKVQHLTWQDLGDSDSQAGLTKALSAIKKGQEFAQESETPTAKAKEAGEVYDEEIQRLLSGGRIG